MRKILFVSLLFLNGCYMRMPNDLIASETIEHYLDSLYKPGKIRYIMYGEFETAATIDKDYVNRQMQLLYIIDKNYKNASYKEKAIYKEKMDSIFSYNQKRGYVTMCRFRVNNVTRIALFNIDTALKKVYNSSIKSK